MFVVQLGLDNNIWLWLFWLTSNLEFILILMLDFSGMMALLVITAMGCGMKNLCKRRNSEDDDDTSSIGYSVPVSTSLFREER